MTTLYFSVRSSPYLLTVTPARSFGKLTGSIAVYDEDIGLTKDELYSLGLQPWGNEPDTKGEETEKVLWLFPYSFYEHIPAGFPIVFIDFRRGEFLPGVSDNDGNFDYLPFGILGRVRK